VRRPAGEEDVDDRLVPPRRPAGPPRVLLGPQDVGQRHQARPEGQPPNLEEPAPADPVAVPAGLPPEDRQHWDRSSLPAGRARRDAWQIVPAAPQAAGLRLTLLFN